MGNDFRIAVRTEGMSTGGQGIAKFREVVDFTVVDRHDVAGFVEDRLAPACQIDDGESAHGEADVVAEPEAVLVGAPMEKARVHCRDEVPGDRTAVEIDYADDSAHAVNSPGRGVPIACFLPRTATSTSSRSMFTSPASRNHWKTSGYECLNWYRGEYQSKVSSTRQS